MSFTYAQQKRQESERDDAERFGRPDMESSFPNSAQLTEPGHRIDMPVVMREKMEGAFGMDLSSVKLYENKAVGEAGAEAVTQGSNIAFAPGKLDFSSTRGQALLGHEMSHVASQARGEVRGSGFVNDSTLEARADQEGIKAARGESIAAGSGVSAAGPMQAKSGKRDRERAEKERAEMESANFYSSTREADEDAILDRYDPDEIRKQQLEIIENYKKTHPGKSRRIKNQLKNHTQKNWQYLVQKHKTLKMPEIEEEEAEQLKEDNEHLIQNEIVPEIMEKKPDETIEDPSEELSPFAAFMRKNNKMNQNQADDINYGLKYSHYKNIINDNNSNTQQQKYKKKKKKRTW